MGRPKKIVTDVETENKPKETTLKNVFKAERGKTYVIVGLEASKYMETGKEYKVTAELAEILVNTNQAKIK
jgi:hypothetical protein